MPADPQPLLASRCPFCGHDVNSTFNFAMTPPPVVTTYVFCMSCSAQGPAVAGQDVEGAIRLWNKRIGRRDAN